MTHVCITSSTTKATLGRLGLIALVPAFALATACSGSDSDDCASSAIEAPASAFPDKPATGTPIKIGLINPEGPAISQPSNREAVEAVAKYANANLGGIAGHPIELVPCASKEDPASNRDFANQMVEAGVTAVVVTTTGHGDAMAPIITKAGIPYMSPSAASSAELTSPNSYLIAASTRSEVRSSIGSDRRSAIAAVT
jgi:branched-chain amino acid transport system substrate-binding protein